ncbi:MAG: DNA-binding NtrC family response regulator [Candidatus Latescibacterota bacterium]|jgi:DNA-binding NtrC family response regulator
MPNRHLLLVDDEPNLQESMKIGLELRDYDVTLASTGQRAISFCQGQSFDAVLLDVRMPEMDGMETLRRIKEVRPEQTVIMLTAHGTIASAVEATKLGAFDYLTKPSSPEEVDVKIQQALNFPILSVKERMVKSQRPETCHFEGMVGTSPAMQEVYDLVERIAHNESTILITGETGTGKELIARAIHDNGTRAEKRLYALHCAAIPEELLESELFGHEKGSFTGAVGLKIGVFEAADGGTLFLDEIGEMSLNAQVRMLRVLQEKEFIRVGATTPRKTDVRLIAATNRTLYEEVKEGRFREDLFYRLNVIEIQMPPLRHRRDDIPMLVTHFLQKFGGQHTLSEEVADTLMRHDWPGNVRELENAIERAVALARTDIIELTDLPPILQDGGTSITPGSGDSYGHLPLRDARDVFEQKYIAELLTKTKGNITHAAKLAGIAWQNFHQKLKKYDIDAKEFANK